ncbi:hypothetical protein K438DRAFT_1773669 [Mycena galopus ATCC 62051]|nr:hypothetical protein K438DRAFT_1773669 [Mycena galopus ATCC 62051]
MSKTSSPSPRLGRKGFLYLQKTAPRAVKPAERVKIVARRMMKAERDERVDVTHALTPIYGRFYTAHDLRSSNWFPGGAYVSKRKVYESPVEEAYQSHTVFILESRYNIRYGVGRVDAPDYVYGVCREEDLPGVLKRYNSGGAPRSVLEAMDNARWPSGPQRKPQPRQRWWVDREDLEQTLREVGSTALPPDPDDQGDEEDLETIPRRRSRKNIYCAPRENRNSQVQPATSLPPRLPFFLYFACRCYGRLGRTQPSVTGSMSGKRGFHTTPSCARQRQNGTGNAPRTRPKRNMGPPRGIHAHPQHNALLAAPPHPHRSTRPIAFTFLRLAKGQPTGRPFHADMDNQDKKCRVSYIHRMRTMRLQRAHNLAVDMAQVLAGLRGGVVGIRFEPDSIGRGIAGEGLADPIPWEKRVIRLKTLFHAKEDEVPASKPFETYTIDDFGNRISDETGEVVPWRPRTQTAVDRLKREPWYGEYTYLNKVEKAFMRHVGAAAAAAARNNVAARKAQEVTVKPAPSPTTTIAAIKPPRETPKVFEASAVDEDDDEDELRLSDDEDTETPGGLDQDGSLASASVSTVPTVLMTAEALQALKSRDPLDDSYLTLATEYPDFVVCGTDGKPVLGLRDKETGEISTKGMQALKPDLARLAIKRRREMFCVTKTEQLGMILAAASSKVDVPARLGAQ